MNNLITTNCFGIENLGQCTYDIANPIIYFTIGEAVTLIAIFIAIYQLIKPTIKFRLNVKKFKEKYLILSYLLILCLVVAAAIIPHTSLFYTKPVVGWPLFWELLAALVFCIVVGAFIFCALSPSRFNKNNYKVFYKYSVNLIATGSNEDINEYTKEMYFFIDDIFGAIQLYNRDEYAYRRRGNIEYELPEITKYAYSLLEVFSDEKICKSLVMRNIDTAIIVFVKIRERELYHSGGYNFVQQIIRQSFINSGSILFREEEYSGLGHLSEFSREIFSNIRLLDSHLNPLGALTYYKDKYDDDKYIEKYIQVLSLVFKSCFEEKYLYSYKKIIRKGLEKLIDISFGYRTTVEVKKNNAHRVEMLIIDLIDLLIKNDKRINEPDFDYDKCRKHKDDSIYNIIAYYIHTFMEKNCSYMDELSEFSARSNVLAIWDKIYNYHGAADANDASRPIREIRDRLSVYVLRKVKENLVHHYFPEMTKLLILLHGLRENHKFDFSKSGDRFQYEFEKLLRIYFDKYLELDNKKERQMLPSNVFYNPIKRAIVVKPMHGRFGITSTFYLDYGSDLEYWGGKFHNYGEIDY